MKLFQVRGAVLCLVAQSCLTLCDPMGCSPPGSSVRGDSPGKNTGVGGHALLQGIFPTQGSNLGLSHCRWILYSLSHQGSLTVLYLLLKNLHHFLPRLLHWYPERRINDLCTVPLTAWSTGHLEGPPAMCCLTHCCALMM